MGLELRGGRKPREEILVEVTGSVGAQELEELLAMPQPKKPEGHQSIKAIKFAHHQLARLLAEGLKQEEISAMTGYSPAYISVVKEDPAFRELLAYYESQKKEIFVDLMERRKTLGLLALEELTSRVTEEPEKFANRELMELHDMSFGKQAPGEGQGTKGPVAPQINISFVSQPSGDAPAVEARETGALIEGSVVEKEPGK